MVFEAAGHRVFVTFNAVSLETSLAEGTFDLLVLCHSLPAEESRRAAAWGRLNWPGLPILTLARGASSHPEPLLSAVRCALAKAEPLDRTS